MAQKQLTNHGVTTTKSGIAPRVFYSQSSIFENKVPSLDVNFLSPTVINEYLQNLTEEQLANLKDEGYNSKEIKRLEEAKEAQANGDLKTAGNSAAILTSVISKWYVALRNIALMGLLIVLVYIGIRILISGTADEQAKYKKMIANWVMAVVLVAVIHYIMFFLLYVTQAVTQLLATSTVYDASSGDTLISTVRTNIALEEDSITKMGYTIMYFVLVIYTLIFTMRYLKRVI